VTRIAFVYSKAHFSPGHPESPFSQTGAGFLAKELYGHFHDLYPGAKIDYYDHSEWSQLSKQNAVDLLFGIGSHLNRFRDILDPEETILFAVNRARPTRLAIRMQARIEKSVRGLPLVSHDGFDEAREFRAEIDAADKILQLGSWSNYYANSICGVSPKKHALVSFKKPVSKSKPSSKPKRSNSSQHILFLAGLLCLRKGLHIILPLVQALSENRSPHALLVVGEAAHPDIAEFLKGCSYQYPKNFRWMKDFIPPESEEWSQLFTNSVLAIAPTFEEGQQDSAMECVARGVPLLHSAEVGFETFAPSALVVDDSSKTWVSKILETLESAESREKIFECQEKLYDLQAPGVSHIGRVLSIHRDSNWRSLSLVSPPRNSRLQGPEAFLSSFSTSTQMQRFSEEYLRLRYPKFKSKLVPKVEKPENLDLISEVRSVQILKELFFSIGSWPRSARGLGFWFENEIERMRNSVLNPHRRAG
jgi:hypothetical protein